MKGYRLFYRQSVGEYFPKLMDEQNPDDSFDPHI